MAGTRWVAAPTITWSTHPAASGIATSPDSQASGEDSLRDADEMEKVRLLRQDLSELDTEEAAQKLGELIGDTSNNAELLDRF